MNQKDAFEQNNIKAHAVIMKYCSKTIKARVEERKDFGKLKYYDNIYERILISIGKRINKKNAIIKISKFEYLERGYTNIMQNMQTIINKKIYYN